MYVYGTSTQTGLAQLFGLSTGYVSRVLEESGAKEAREAHRQAVQNDAAEQDYAEYIDLQRETLRAEREGTAHVMRKAFDWITKQPDSKTPTREFERVVGVLERCYDRLLARSASGAVGTLPPIVMSWLPERAIEQLSDNGPDEEP